MARKKMSKEESQDWEELYMYVKNLMGYDENQSLSKHMVLRLKGLLTGKFIENKNIKDNSNYSYKTILNTFKFCSFDIKNAFRSKSFKDESHKFNYALVIVEKNIYGIANVDSTGFESIDIAYNYFNYLVPMCTMLM